MEKKMLIDGMKCMHCKASVEKALKGVAGVTEAEVDLEVKTARIVLDADVADDVLMAAVKEKGFEPVTVSELLGYDLPETSEELYVYRKK